MPPPAPAAVYSTTFYLGNVCSTSVILIYPSEDRLSSHFKALVGVDDSFYTNTIFGINVATPTVPYESSRIPLNQSSILPALFSHFKALVGFGDSSYTNTTFGINVATPTVPYESSCITLNQSSILPASPLYTWPAIIPNNINIILKHRPLLMLKGNPDSAYSNIVAIVSASHTPTCTNTMTFSTNNNNNNDKNKNNMNNNSYYPKKNNINNKIHFEYLKSFMIADKLVSSCNSYMLKNAVEYVPANYEAFVSPSPLSCEVNTSTITCSLKVYVCTTPLSRNITSTTNTLTCDIYATSTPISYKVFAVLAPISNEVYTATTPPSHEANTTINAFNSDISTTPTHVSFKFSATSTTVIKRVYASTTTPSHDRTATITALSHVISATSAHGSYEVSVATTTVRYDIYAFPTPASYGESVNITTSNHPMYSTTTFSQSISDTTTPVSYELFAASTFKRKVFAISTLFKCKALINTNPSIADTFSYGIPFTPTPVSYEAPTSPSPARNDDYAVTTTFSFKVSACPMFFIFEVSTTTTTTTFTYDISATPISVKNVVSVTITPERYEFHAAIIPVSCNLSAASTTFSYDISVTPKSGNFMVFFIPIPVCNEVYGTTSLSKCRAPSNSNRLTYKVTFSYDISSISTLVIYVVSNTPTPTPVCKEVYTTTTCNCDILAMPSPASYEAPTSSTPVINEASAFTVTLCYGLHATPNSVSIAVTATPTPTSTVSNQVYTATTPSSHEATATITALSYALSLTPAHGCYEVSAATTIIRHILYAATTSLLNYKVSLSTNPSSYGVDAITTTIIYGVSVIPRDESLAAATNILNHMVATIFTPLRIDVSTTISTFTYKASTPTTFSNCLSATNTHGSLVVSTTPATTPVSNEVSASTSTFSYGLSTNNNMVSFGYEVFTVTPTPVKKKVSNILTPLKYDLSDSPTPACYVLSGTPIPVSNETYTDTTTWIYKSSGSTTTFCDGLPNNTNIFSRTYEVFPATTTGVNKIISNITTTFSYGICATSTPVSYIVSVTPTTVSDEIFAATTTWNHILSPSTTTLSYYPSANSHILSCSYEVLPTTNTLSILVFASPTQASYDKADYITHIFLVVTVTTNTFTNNSHDCHNGNVTTIFTSAANVNLYSKPELCAIIITDEDTIPFLFPGKFTNTMLSRILISRIGKFTRITIYLLLLRRRYDPCSQPLSSLFHYPISSVVCAYNTPLVLPIHRSKGASCNFAGDGPPKNQKFYAVAIGRQPGIYRTWSECERQVMGYKGANFKSFKTQEEANAFMSSQTTEPTDSDMTNRKRTQSQYIRNVNLEDSPRDNKRSSTPPITASLEPPHPYYNPEAFLARLSQDVKNDHGNYKRPRLSPERSYTTHVTSNTQSKRETLMSGQKLYSETSQQNNEDNYQTSEIACYSELLSPSDNLMANNSLKTTPRISEMEEEKLHESPSSQTTQTDEIPALICIATCNHCTNPGVFLCGECFTVVYCSQACQQRHWLTTHSGVCQQPNNKKAAFISTLSSVARTALFLLMICSICAPSNSMHAPTYKNSTCIRTISNFNTTSGAKTNNSRPMVIPKLTTSNYDVSESNLPSDALVPTFKQSSPTLPTNKQKPLTIDDQGHERENRYTNIYSGTNFLRNLHELAGNNHPHDHVLQYSSQISMSSENYAVPRSFTLDSLITLNATTTPNSLPDNQDQADHTSAKESSNYSVIVLAGLNVQTLRASSKAKVKGEKRSVKNKSHSNKEEDGETSKLPMLLQEFKYGKIDCIAMSETRVRLLENGDHPKIMLKEGYNIYFSGTGPERSQGVGLAISTKWTIKYVSPISTRIMYICAFVREFPITVFSIYAPTEPENIDISNMEVSEKVEDFYLQLQESLETIPSEFRNCVIILGDFNAQVGPPIIDPDDPTGSVRGTYIQSPLTYNGRALLDFCLSNSFIIADTYFPRTEYGTWRIPSTREYKNAIDHILVLQNQEPTKNMIIDCGVCLNTICNTDAYTDHRRMELRISIPRFHRNKIVPPQRNGMIKNSRLDFSTLRTDADLRLKLKTAIDDIYELRMKQILASFDLPTIEVANKAIDDSIREACHLVLPCKEKTKKTVDWFQENKVAMEELIMNKRDAWKSYRRGKVAEDNGKVVTNLKKRLKKARRISEKVKSEGTRFRNEFWVSIAKDMDELFLKNAWGPLTTKIKMVYGQSKEGYRGGQVGERDMLRKRDGTLTTSLEEVNDRFFEYFEELLNQGSNVPSDTWSNILPQQMHLSETLGAPFTTDECRIALDQLPNNKAPGVSNIPSESVRYSMSEKLIEVQCNIFNNMLATGYVPQELKDIKVLPIFKKGSRDLCDNFRGISLMEHKMKWIERLILNRLQPFAEGAQMSAVLPDSQWGFRKDRSAVDAIMINRLITNSALSRNCHIYKCFVDLSKAYDRVDRPLLWELLRKIGVPTKLVQLIENIHVGSRATVFTPGVDRSSKQFLLSRGLKQGSVLAPLLFNIFYGALLCRMRVLLSQRGVGMRVSVDINRSPLDKKSLTDAIHKNTGRKKKSCQNQPQQHVTECLLQELLYADDCVLLAETEQDLQELIYAFTKAAEEFGQDVASAKTKVMVTQMPCRGPKACTIPPKLHLHEGDESALEVVEQFSYLGSIDSQDGNTEIELNQRISRMRGAFFRLAGRVFENGALSLEAKLSLYKMFVVPVALYGCATWDLTRAQVKKLDTCQYHLLRRILKSFVPRPEYPKQISYESLLNAATSLGPVNIYSMETMIFATTLRYLGHIERSPPHTMTRQFLHGHITKKESGISWKLQTYKNACTRAIVAFDVPSFFSTTGDPNAWVRACGDSSKEGKSRWSKALRIGAKNHDITWRKGRQEKRKLSMSAEVKCQTPQIPHEISTILDTETRATDPPPQPDMGSQIVTTTSPESVITYTMDTNKKCRANEITWVRKKKAKLKSNEQNKRKNNDLESKGASKVPRNSLIMTSPRGFYDSPTEFMGETTDKHISTIPSSLGTLDRMRIEDESLTPLLQILSEIATAQHASDKDNKAITPEIPENSSTKKKSRHRNGSKRQKFKLQRRRQV